MYSYLVVCAKVLVLLKHLQLPASPQQHGADRPARQVCVQLGGEHADAPRGERLEGAEQHVGGQNTLTPPGGNAWRGRSNTTVDSLNHSSSARGF